MTGVQTCALPICPRKCTPKELKRFHRFNNRTSYRYWLTVATIIMQKINPHQLALTRVFTVSRSKRWRSDESICLCGPGSNPCIDAICGLSLLLVVSFVLRGFSPGTQVFPSPQRSTFPIPVRPGIG